MDLNSLVVLPKSQNANIRTPVPRAFMRSSTAPALLPSPEIFQKCAASRTMGKLFIGPSREFLTQPSFDSLDDTKRHMIKLCLSQNSIRRLPRELFNLSTLVVLSLRT